MSISVRIEQVTPGAEPQVVSERVFDKDEVTIGRAPGNDVVLQSQEVSSTHAKLFVDAEGSLCLSDLKSSNGTFIEDTRLPPGGVFRLPTGKRAVIGSFLVIASNELGKEAASESSRSEELPKTKTSGPEALSSKVAHNGAAVSPLKMESESQIEAEFEIKRTIHNQLIERLDLRRKDIAQLSESELRTRARNVVEQILVDLRWEIPDGLDRESLIRQVLDEALGLGPLEELLADENCSEVMVNNYRQIYAERNGKLQLTDLRFSGERAVLSAIERILAPIGRRIDESSPMVDARLKDGSRVNAVIRPLALQGPCITIRKFSKDPLVIDDLVRFGSLSKGMAEFMKLAVSNRLNVVISGGTGSGKTTLLNVIAGFVPEGERVITVEDAAELRLPQEHVVSFETRPPNLEGKGAVTIRDLVRNALRMRPDRIIVGECRGAEALDMLQAMNTGHDGSMTTGHANSPEDMIRRLETMVLTAGLDLPVRAIREQIASAVDIIVQQTRFACGSRKITSISEVVGIDYDEGVVMLEEIFAFCQEGYGSDGRVSGYHQASGYVPKFFQALQKRGLPVNADVFSPGRVS